MDLSISKNHFVKGDKIISAMKEVVPDINIEDLPIPYCTIATDLYTGQEVVFNTGKLFDAIRASISIPSLFRPVKYGLTTLIDGGIANCLPMSRVARSGEDILVAFDVNHVDVDEIRQIMLREHDARQKDESFEMQKRTEVRELIAHVKSTEDTLLTRLKYAGTKSISLLKDVISYRKAFDEEAALAYEELSDCIPGGDCPVQKLEEKELAAVIDRFLESLPRQSRKVFVCRYWYFESIAEIALRFGFSQSKVKSILFRVRGGLKKALEKEGMIC